MITIKQPISDAIESAESLTRKYILRNLNIGDLIIASDQVKLSQRMLPSTKGAIERRFLRIGTALEDLITVGSNLVERCNRLNELNCGENGADETITEATNLIQPALRHIESSCARLTNIVSCLGNGRAHVDDVLSIEENLEATLEPLKYVQTMFRIECAAFSATEQQIFTDLVHEIQRVREVFQGLFGKFSNIREMIGLVSNEVKTQTESQRKISDKRSKEIDATIEQINARVSNDKNRLDRLVSHSECVKDISSNIVTALQLQDIVNQRIEHVEGALELIETQLSEADLVKRSQETVNALSSVIQIAPVVAKQITGILRDISQAETNAETHLGLIMSEMNQFNAESDEISGAKNYDHSTSLRQAIHDISIILEEIDTHACQSHDFLKPIIDQTIEISDTLSVLATEVHLLGLNSQIKAAHIGNGTGLETLASKTSAVSNEISRLGDKVSNSIDIFTTEIQSTMNDFVEIRERGQEIRANFAENAPKIEQNLIRSKSNTASELDKVAATLVQLRKCSENCSNYKGRDSDLRSLRKLKNAINALLREAVDLSGRVPETAATADFTDDIRSTYTMASERDAHDLATGAESDTQPIEIQDGFSETLFDDFTDFSEDSNETENANSSKEEKEKKPEDNVDLWD